MTLQQSHVLLERQAEAFDHTSTCAGQWIGLQWAVLRTSGW